jgi:hypothetical protein
MPIYGTTLPGPDRPRIAVRLPRRPDRPPKKKKYPAPKGYLGGWAKPPGLPKKKFKTIKTGKGYFIAKKLKPKVTPPRGPQAPGVPGVPKPPPGPYSKYPEWARQTLRQYDVETQREQEYGTQVQQWLTGALAPIQAAGQAATQNYRTSMAGLPNAGNMLGIPTVAGTAPGGVTAGTPEAWKTQAAQTAAAGYSTIQQGQSAISSFLNDAKIGNLRSALETNFAQDLLRLGETRKKEKFSYMAKLDQFMAESEAEAKQKQAELIARTTNDWYDFVAQLTNAGIKLTDINLEAMEQPTGTGGIFIPDPTGQNKPAPVPGKQWVREPNGWRAVDLPTPQQGRAAPKPTGLIGPIDPGTPVPPGYVKVRSGGKTYWRQKGTAAGGGAAAKPVSPAERRQQYKDALKLWRGTPPNNTLGTGGQPGLSTARVNRWTDEEGNLAPGHTSQADRNYVFYVRSARLLEQVLSLTGNKKRAADVMRGIVGARNYARFNQWYLSSDRGNLSFYAAKKRRHV